MIQIAIRAARASDEASLLAMVTAEMENHARLDPRFRLRRDAAARYAVYLRDRARDLDSAIFVAEREGRVVGGVIASVRVQESFFEARRFGYVSDLVVDPEFRRQGIGRALWEKARTWLRVPGVDIIRLHVAARSEAARAFWKSVGAEEFLTEMWVEAKPPRPETETAEPAAEEPEREPEPVEPGGGEEPA
jgi:ribosomal protein S18 acetylase RimI-like enzyme